MCLETLQLLYTALHLSWSPHTWPIKPYKLTHAKHPSAKWVRMSSETFQWTLQLGYAIALEYEKRYGRVHACTIHYKHMMNMHLPYFNETITFHPEKVAHCNVPKCASMFPLAIEDAILPTLVAYSTNGQIDGVETYTNYYNYKSKILKRKMRWFQKDSNLQSQWKMLKIQHEDRLCCG